MTADTVEGSIALTEEGGGVVATCRPCGWLRWGETRAEVLTAGREHKCRKEDLKPPGQRYLGKKKKRGG
jgi:hypothetical protein